MCVLLGLDPSRTTAVKAMRIAEEVGRCRRKVTVASVRAVDAHMLQSSTSSIIMLTLLVLDLRYTALLILLLVLGLGHTTVVKVMSTAQVGQLLRKLIAASVRAVHAHVPKSSTSLTVLALVVQLQVLIVLHLIAMLVIRDGKLDGQYPRSSIVVIMLAVHAVIMTVQMAWHCGGKTGITTNSFGAVSTSTSAVQSRLKPSGQLTLHLYATLGPPAIGPPTSETIVARIMGWAATLSTIRSHTIA